jgi:hypothetical protein
MMQAGKRLAFIAAAALALTAVGSAAVAPLVISVSPPSIRLGGYRVDRQPTYAGAIAALGRSSSCKRVGGDASHARASWSALGLVIELQTYGGLPAGKTGCTAPRQMKIHTVRVTSRRWTTSRGLHVGDTVSQLKTRYSAAKPAKPLAGWYARGYWLATRRVGGYEGVGGFRPFAPVLVAETHDGRVTAFVLVIGGEGD